LLFEIRAHNLRQSTSSSFSMERLPRIKERLRSSSSGNSVAALLPCECTCDGQPGKILSKPGLLLYESTAGSLPECPYCAEGRTDDKLSVAVQIHELEERIRALCKSALKARATEVPAILWELQAALHQHNELVRNMAADSLKRPKNQSDAKAAD
jgi:hypothetical protein